MNASNILRAGLCTVAIFLFVLLGRAVAAGPNEILRTLLTVGVPLADGQAVKLPQPTLADGMTAAEQRQQIETIAEGRNSWEDLTRRSVVAPFILKNLAGRSRSAEGRRVDLWFVAYGSLDTLASDDFLRTNSKRLPRTPRTRPRLDCWAMRI